MKYLLLILTLLLVEKTSQLQEVQFELKDSILGSFNCMSVDNFGRIYLVEEDVIKLHSAENVELFSSSLKTLRPTTIESSKSFRALVFDRDRSIIQFLDNTLTDISGEIDLVSLEIQQPHLVCESFSGNHFWVFDAGSMRLLKMNDLLETVSVIENLGTVFSEDLLPLQMREFNDFLFFMVPDKGLAVFDIFGTFLKMIPIDGLKYVDVLGDYFVGLTNEYVTSIPLNQLLEPIYHQTNYPVDSNVLQFSFKKNLVYFLKPNGLFMGNYDFSDPNE